MFVHRSDSQIETLPEAEKYFLLNVLIVTDTHSDQNVTNGLLKYHPLLFPVVKMIWYVIGKA